MKQHAHLILTFSLLIGLIPGLSAQSPTIHKRTDLWQAQKMTPIHDQVMSVEVSGDQAQNRGTEMDVIIGQSIYDLQTNYSACNRLSKDADGNIMAVWTQGFIVSDGFSDRGTGYNSYDAGSDSWGNIPGQRLEDGVRTGWPNHVITESGTEFIVSHVFTNGEYRLHTLRREAGETDWTESDIPSDTPVGVLWPRASGSGETVHVLAITTPTGSLGGEIYEGVDIHPLYYRSSDGGETWDVTDFIIPGLDSSFMISMVNADSYSMHARGDKVAIGIFSQWNDITVFYSEDGGNTWDNIRLFDFPIKKYEINSGYTFDQLPPYDPAQPDSMAILTSDNSGNILIDQNGNMHAWFGRMYVQDSDLADAGWTYYPATSGLYYWNESHGADSVRIIADVLDLNGNDTLDIDGIGSIGLYFMSLSSMPSAGVDENGSLYLAYSALMEGEDYIDEYDLQHYRHIFIIKSEDGGETWGEPFDAINETTVGSPLFLNKIEAVFPHMLKDLEDDVQFIYQQDFQPGMSQRGDLDPATEVQIIFTQIGTLLTGANDLAVNEQLGFEVFPNPASEEVTINFDLKSAGLVQLELYDASGKMVRQLVSANYPAGQNSYEADLNNLAAGLYFIRLRTGMQAGIQKLLVD